MKNTVYFHQTQHFRLNIIGICSSGTDGEGDHFTSILGVEEDIDSCKLLRLEYVNSSIYYRTFRNKTTLRNELLRAYQMITFFNTVICFCCI